MRFSAAALLLPVLALAQEQQPLLAKAQNWFAAAKSYVPAALASPSAAASAVLTAATARATASAAGAAIVPLTKANWQTVLAPQAAAQTWLVLITGGNKTCLGRDCAGAERAFEGAATSLAADPRAPRLARVDCDDPAASSVCVAWWAAPPTVWHVAVPSLEKMRSEKEVHGVRAPTSIHGTTLNGTAVTAQQVRELHTKGNWERAGPIEGYFHPFDGVVARWGLLMAFGRAMDVLGKIPPWMMMIVVSFITRNMMSRRMQGQQQAQAPGQAGPQRPRMPPMGGAPAADEGYPPESYGRAKKEGKKEAKKE